MTSRDVYFFGNACAFSSRKAVLVPTSVIGGLGAPWRPAILYQKLLEIEKEIVREVARGDKPYLRKSTDRKAQINPLN